jgi:copper(I)-binding protein
MTKIGITLLGMMLLGACSQQEKAPADQNAEEILQRVRPAATGGTSAAYFTYSNKLEKADTLLSVQADVAGMAQVHESYETDGGMMGMREQKEIPISPGEELQFKPGGLHVMLMNLKRDLQVGDSVEVTVNFAQAGQTRIKLPVLQ